MKHRRNPLAMHQATSLRKLSRAEYREMLLAPWRQIRATEGNELAFRAYILRREGAETLVNVIRGAHGLPNRY